MKKLVVILSLVLSLFAFACLAEDYGQTFADAGYEVYESGPLLVLMVEAGDSASISNPDMFPGLDEDDPALLDYVNSFDRVLLFVLKNDAVYFGVEIKPPVDDADNQASALFSQDALGEMFAGMSAGQ